MSKSVIVGTDTVYAALITRCNANFTELYNMLTGVAASTLLTPTIASFANATHTHANAAGGGATLTSPTIATPTITGTTTTIATEAWTQVSSFGTSWAAGDDVFYMKDPMGFVHLEGTVVSSIDNNTNVIFTLPTGYVPDKTWIGWRVKDRVTLEMGTLTIAASTGQITGSNVQDLSVFILDGIVFKAA